MEFIVMIIELFLSFVDQIGTPVALTVFGAILVFYIRSNNKDKRNTDENIVKILDSQKDMRKEYTEKFSDLEIKMEESDRRQQASLAVIEEQQKDNNLMTLRSIITNTALPEEYRLKNYDIYVELGGNSWVNKYVKEELLQEKVGE